MPFPDDNRHIPHAAGQSYCTAIGPAMQQCRPTLASIVSRNWGQSFRTIFWRAGKESERFVRSLSALGQ